jgi:uncharacterized protein (DUF3820 family)
MKKWLTRMLVDLPSHRLVYLRKSAFICGQLPFSDL